MLSKRMCRTVSQRLCSRILCSLDHEVSHKSHQDGAWLCCKGVGFIDRGCSLCDAGEGGCFNVRLMSTGESSTLPLASFKLVSELQRFAQKAISLVSAVAHLANFLHEATESVHGGSETECQLSRLLAVPPKTVLRWQRL